MLTPGLRVVVPQASGQPGHTGTPCAESPNNRIDIHRWTDALAENRKAGGRNALLARIGLILDLAPPCPAAGGPAECLTGSAFVTAALFATHRFFVAAMIRFRPLADYSSTAD